MLACAHCVPFGEQMILSIRNVSSVFTRKVVPVTTTPCIFPSSQGDLIAKRVRGKYVGIKYTGYYLFAIIHLINTNCG